MSVAAAGRGTGHATCEDQQPCQCEYVNAMHARYMDKTNNNQQQPTTTNSNQQQPTSNNNSCNGGNGH
ncbi:hypothetical protein ACLKA6_008227 [Drosophila palustris]